MSPGLSRAEFLTLADAPGASRTFLGGVIAYATEIKPSLLGVDPGLNAVRGGERTGGTAIGEPPVHGGDSRVAIRRTAVVAALELLRDHLRPPEGKS
ncbi:MULTISPECIES: CinA family protein [unclassified Streptomyces]|uniref:CinA family protein n=1 Tax=unclassified Streptomyces TaxID=2593676 RepID=UPI0038698971